MLEIFLKFPTGFPEVFQSKALQERPIKRNDRFPFKHSYITVRELIQQLHTHLLPSYSSLVLQQGFQVP